MFPDICEFWAMIYHVGFPWCKLLDLQISCNSEVSFARYRIFRETMDRSGCFCTMVLEQSVCFSNICEFWYTIDFGDSFLQYVDVPKFHVWFVDLDLLIDHRWFILFYGSFPIDHINSSFAHNSSIRNLIDLKFKMWYVFPCHFILIDLDWDMVRIRPTIVHSSKYHRFPTLIIVSSGFLPWWSQKSFNQLLWYTIWSQGGITLANLWGFPHKAFYL